jgi:hypothetical protein
MPSWNAEGAEIVHWSDWASQPGIRVACTQEGHFPWQYRKDLPPEVHEVPETKDGKPGLLYTFDTDFVTCPDCRKLASFQAERKRVLAYQHSRPHTWSGWPGAYCLNCGAEDKLEICLADHEHPCGRPECRNGPCLGAPEPLRPSGTVEVVCEKCGCSFWVDALHPTLPNGPFVCVTCEHGAGPLPKGETEGGV